MTVDDDHHLTGLEVFRQQVLMLSARGLTMSEASGPTEDHSPDGSCSAHRQRTTEAEPTGGRRDQRDAGDRAERYADAHALGDIAR